MTTALGRRDFRLLIAGQITSSFGDWMATIAFMALVLDLTDSSTAVAGILVIRLAPTTIAGPLAARLVRRWDRKRLMILMDLVRVGIVVAVPFVHAVWWVYVWAFALEVAGLVFLPARDSAIPDLVGDGSELETANALVLASSYATIPLGAGAYGAVAALSPSHGIFAFGPVFWFDAFTFLVSAAIITRVAGIRPTPARTEADAPVGFLRSFRIPLVRAVMPLTAAAALGIGALFSLGIVFVRDVLGASNTEFGVLVALFGVGAGGGLALLRLTHDESINVVRFAVFVQGVVISLMSLAPNIGITFLGAAGFGAGAGAAITSGMSFLQRHLEGEDLVLAFTTFHIVIRGGLALAAIGAGVAGDLVDGVDWPVVGPLQPVRLVLFLSGVVVAAGPVLTRGRVAHVRAPAAGPARRAAE